MAKQPHNGLMELSAETIPLLNNGAAAMIIDKQIKLAVADLLDRGAEDGKPREVTIKLTMAVVNKMNVVEVSAGSKVPAYVSGGTQGDIRVRTEKGEQIKTFVFRENGGRPDQPEFDEFEGDKKQRGG